MSPMRLKIVMNRLSMPYSYNNLKKKTKTGKLFNRDCLQIV